MQDYYKVTDNFLDTGTYNTLSNELLMPSFPWYPSSIDAEENEGNKLRNMQFVHYFYENNMAMDGCNILFPLVKKIDPLAVLRIKGNITLQHDTQLKHNLHVDITNTTNPTVMVSIFYLNTNNGWTEFEDGVKIHSVANRLVTFPNYIKHTSVSCSDQTYRMVLNLNYIISDPQNEETI